MCSAADGHFGPTQPSGRLPGPARLPVRGRRLQVHSEPGPRASGNTGGKFY